MEARPERRKNSNKGRHSEGTVRSNAGFDPDDVREDGAGWRRRRERLGGVRRYA